MGTLLGWRLSLSLASCDCNNCYWLRLVSYLFLFQLLSQSSSSGFEIPDFKLGLADLVFLSLVLWNEKVHGL